MTNTWPPVGGRPSRARHPAGATALSLLVCVAIAISLASAPARAGSEILREAYAPSAWGNAFANVYSNQKVAQSFVARTSFLVTHLELFVFDQPDNSPPDLLQVFIALDAGNRPGTALASTARQGPQSWSWVPFGFYPWVPLSAGERYWIVAEDAQPRPKGYEWAMNAPGGYAAGEAQWHDPSSGVWINNTGADMYFRIFGISGPSLNLEVEPTLAAVDPGATVPFDIYFNNSGNDVARTAAVEVSLAADLSYAGDDASSEGGSLAAPLRWSFNDVGVGPHHFTVWTKVNPDPTYYDGQSLASWVFLNYTDASGASQAPLWDVATVTILVPVIRVEAAPMPAHVAPGETFNFSLSFFNVGSGRAEYLWLNATSRQRITILRDDAPSAGGTPVGMNAWLFRNVSAQAYVFNVTVRADPDAMPGDRLALYLIATYTDGGGHPFGETKAVGSAAIHGPSLVVEAAADEQTPHPGDVVRVTLYANNTGDENASRVWLNGTLPAWTTLVDSQPIVPSRVGSSLAYEMRDVAPGGHAVALRLWIEDGAPPATWLAFAASLNLTDASGVLLRPSVASADLEVVTPRFSVSIAAATASVGPGDPIDLTLRWNNSGNEAAKRIWFNFTLPSKTLLVNSSMPWTYTNGTTFGWELANVGPGERLIDVRLEVSARAASGEDLYARLDLRYERSDGFLSQASVDTAAFHVALTSASALGLELVMLWIAVLVAVFLLFLLLGYMDVLPHKRTMIDDVFLLHNSGVLICHYSTTLRPDVDSDIASGMLMAVRNFVADAMRTKNGSLQELKYGDHRIHMVHGRHAILVTFTRGGNGRNMEMRMAEALRNIETAYEKILESWSGRTEDFKGVEEYLLKLVAV